MNHRILLASALASAIGLMAISPQAQARDLSCKLDFNMTGWSVFYKRSSGEGVVRCDNGQSLPVRIEARGGGLTFGKSKIENGIGKFSPISNINDVIGGYATAEANAGAGKAAKGQVVTKGPISLALSGKGKGWELGVSFGSFVISKR